MRLHLNHCSLYSLMKKKPDHFVYKAIRQMFKVAGHKYSEDILKQGDWFQKYEWDKSQQKKYKRWFLKTAQKELHLNRAIAEKEYSWFNLMWGLKDKV